MAKSSRVEVSGYWRVSSRGVRHYVRPYSRFNPLKVPAIGDPGTWIERRYLLRWRDETGRKRSKFIRRRMVKDG